MITETSLSPTARSAIQYLKPLGLFAVVTGVMCLGLYVFFLRPAQLQLDHVRQQHHIVAGQYQEHQNSHQVQQSLQHIWATLPEKHEFTDLGVTIAKLAKQNKVVIPGMGYHVEPTKHGVSSRGALGFEAAGGYEAIRRFIYKVETSRPHLFIEKLTAERTKKGNRVAFKITVGTFFQPPNAKIVNESS